MFDPDLIDSYPENMRVMIRQSLGILASTGVLLKQKERLFARVASGADNEDPQELATRLLDYRRQSHALQHLHDEGLRFLENTGEE